MKKFIALLTASVLFCSLTAFAADSPSAAVVADTTETTSSIVTEAAAAQMSVGEYINNAVVETPGIAEATPVGQGGKILINGVPTNMTVTLGKVSKATVTSAQTLGGKLLNVVNTKIPGANFTTATVNFYLKGLVGTEKVKAFQLVKGEWVAVEILEIRADHVVLNLKQSGPVAFLAE